MDFGDETVSNTDEWLNTGCCSVCEGIPIDAVQSNMLSVIGNMMVWYHLTPDAVANTYGMIRDHKKQVYTPEASVIESEPLNESSIWIATRREFRDMLSEGLKICVNYTNCTEPDCGNFHVRRTDICDHAIDANYCNDNTCSRIIIKKCKKANKCKDDKCSFRHLDRE